MRPKELCFLVAFHTTTEALALEEAARSAGSFLYPLKSQRDAVWRGECP